MSEPPRARIFLPDETATAELGERIAPLLRAGDTLLLQGPIGAGKSHLARALIRHADLYRLTHPDEVWELGLDDAFATAICLVEWPDRLGSHLPHDALHIALSVEGDGRTALLSGGRAGLVAAIMGAA